MKTKCYCIGCKLHPLHDKRGKLPWYVGWDIHRITMRDYSDSAADVNCLKPESKFFDEFLSDPGDFDWPVTAYGDGEADTGHDAEGFTIYAVCGNEDHEE